MLILFVDRCIKAYKYYGRMNVTTSGKPCLPWKGQKADTELSNFPEGSATLAKNYCRSPDNADYLWCYVESHINYEPCSVDLCKISGT